MTNEDLIHDLKQFIEATVSQQTDRLEKRMGAFDQRLNDTGTKVDLKALEERLDTRLDGIQDAVADTLTCTLEALDTQEQVQDLEHRVTRLENQAA